jgi:hypothetical protein
VDHAPLLNDSLEELLGQLDPRMIAIGLACASLTPSVAGYAGAVAAIAFDVKYKEWYGAALSAASMIPLVGYVPGAFKVGWLLRLLDRDLKKLEEQLPMLHQSPEAVSRLRTAFDKYYNNLPNIKVTRPLRIRLAHIMALDEPTQSAASTEPAVEPISSSVNKP